VDIERLVPGDEQRVVAASRLFDEPATNEWTHRFLTSEGHHLLFAVVDGIDAGFVTGVEMTHPDKGTEMLVYELGVDEPFQRQGIGHALVDALAAVAREGGCYGMWVLTDDDNAAAVSTYGAAGATSTGSQTLLEWRFSP
jgi:ribosomal protein S18 acetylase RimI-like enzyme